MSHFGKAPCNRLAPSSVTLVPRSSRNFKFVSSEHIGQLRNLTSLNLGGTPVTDKGLEHLSELTNLKFLELRGTKVTDEGTKRLQGALPKCNIKAKGQRFH